MEERHLSDCGDRDGVIFTYPLESHYFNDTALYVRYIDKLAEYMGCPYSPGEYDAWFQISNASRPGDFGYYETLWWYYNGSLYYDQSAMEWVIVNEDRNSRLLQIGGSGFAHPDWITSWAEYNITDYSYNDMISNYTVVQVRCGCDSFFFRFDFFVVIEILNY